MPTFISMAAPAVAAASPWAIALPGLIGAAAALTGVLITAVWTSRNQSKLLSANTSEKALDRTMALRKEAYLPVLTSLQVIQSKLPTLPTVRPFDYSVFLEFSQALAKLSLVAETSTAILASDVNAALGVAFLDLLETAQPALNTLSDIDLAREYRESNIRKSDAVQTKIEEHRQAGRPRDDIYEALLRDKEWFFEQGQSYWTTENAAMKKHGELTIAYLRALIGKIPAISEQVGKLMIALRRDIHIKTDETEFLEAGQRQCALMVASLESLLANQERRLAEYED